MFNRDEERRSIEIQMNRKERTVLITEIGQSSIDENINTRFDHLIGVITPEIVPTIPSYSSSNESHWIILSLFKENDKPICGVRPRPLFNPLIETMNIEIIDNFQRIFIFKFSLIENERQCHRGMFQGNFIAFDYIQKKIR